MASPPPALPWYATFGAAGLGACIAEIVTLPIDTAKVRLQLLKKSGAAPSLGMLGMVRNIALNEGTLALYKGFWPAIHRQLVFASLRVGLYGQVGTLQNAGSLYLISVSALDQYATVTDFRLVQDRRTGHAFHGLKNPGRSCVGCDRHHDSERT